MLSLPQVKRDLISSIKTVVYDLPHEFPRGVIRQVLSNLEILLKSEIWLVTPPSVQCPFYQQIVWTNIQKTGKNRCRSFLFLSNFAFSFSFTFSNIFCKGWSDKTNFCPWIVPVSSQFQYIWIVLNLRFFFKCLV